MIKHTIDIEKVLDGVLQMIKDSVKYSDIPAEEIIVTIVGMLEDENRSSLHAALSIEAVDIGVLEFQEIRKYLHDGKERNNQFNVDAYLADILKFQSQLPH